MERREEKEDGKEGGGPAGEKTPGVTSVIFSAGEVGVSYTLNRLSRVFICVEGGQPDVTLTRGPET